GPNNKARPQAKPARSQSDVPSARCCASRRRAGTRSAVPPFRPWRASGEACTAVLAKRQNQQTKGHAAMGLFSRDIKSLDDLFVHTLRDIYYAENQIAKSLSDMIDKANDPQLKRGFKTHLEETNNHIARLDEVFRMRGVEIEGVDCPAIDGILEEADDVA